MTLLCGGIYKDLRFCRRISVYQDGVITIPFIHNMMHVGSNLDAGVGLFVDLGFGVEF
jgi:hypothetical protein